VTKLHHQNDLESVKWDVKPSNI